MLDIDLIHALGDALRGDLPGTEAHLEMAPAYRHDASLLSVQGKPCRHAAVLVLLYPKDGGMNVVLTLRTDDLPDHPGQISFPGGRQEPGEALEDTAPREATGEMGLQYAMANVLGELWPLFLGRSNFSASPTSPAQVRYRGAGRGRGRPSKTRRSVRQTRRLVSNTA